MDTENLEDKTFEIIAEWHRGNGDHVFIGKADDNTYIEVMFQDSGIVFDIIKDYKSLN